MTPSVLRGFLLGVVLVGLANVAQARRAASQPPEKPAMEPIPARPDTEVTDKSPPPDPASLATAGKMVRDLFVKEIAAARKPEEKLALAKKLMQAGVEEQKDPAGQFALLSLAEETALASGELETIWKGIEEIEKRYTVDSLKMRMDALAGWPAAAHGVEERRRFLARVLDVVATAIHADRFDIAKPAADLAIKRMPLISDADLFRQAMAAVQQVRDTEAGYVEAKDALAALTTKPSDADANLKAGKYRCFIKEEWEGGLRMLALGNDPILSPLAVSELAGASDADAQFKLAEGWWDAGQTQGTLGKASASRHAAGLYKSALPGLTGLAKAKAEGRVKAVDSAGGGGWTDLMKLVNPQAGTLRGHWKLEANGVSSDGNDFCLLDVPYILPREYDVRYSFTRAAGESDIGVNLAFGEKQRFVVNWTQKGLGLDRVGDKRAWEAGGVGILRPLVNGQTQTVLVKVRQTRIEVAIDGKTVINYAAEGKNLEPVEEFRLKNGNHLGLVAWHTAVTFHSLEVRGIGDAGRIDNKVP